MTTRFTAALERWQIAFYLVAIGFGCLIGHFWTTTASAAGALL